MEKIQDFYKSRKQNLNNKGFETPELIILVTIIAIIIILGIIIGSIILGSKKEYQGIVKINYNSNGGTGEMTATECRIGSDCILKNNKFKKVGYDFSGWSKSKDENKVTYKINDTYNANKNITLYAIWEQRKITITYDANGGTGEMEETIYTYGQSELLLPKNVYEKKGYTFNGWQIYSPTQDKWYGCQKKDTVCNDESETLGWHNRDKIAKYYNSETEWDTTKSDYDMTFYAQWGESVYAIKYELNGGINGKNSPTSGVYGSKLTISNPTKKGYKFNGWTLTGKDATLNKTELTVGTSDITLTAKWEVIPVEKEAIKITDYIQNLYNNTSLRNQNSLKKDSTSDNNIRYVGSNPKNYVSFNNELWRIIGIFNVSNGSTTTKRIKLIRDDILLNASWDSSASNINNGNGINEWSQSDIKNMLNEYYVGISSSCKYCNGDSQSSCSKYCSTDIKKIDSESLNMIENAVWNIGAIPYDDSPGDEIASVLDAYNKEKGNRTGKQCSGSGTNGNCSDSVKRTTKWTGKIGLISMSDYGFASTDNNCHNNITYNENCKNNNWLNNGKTYWTITPRDSTYFANAGWYVNTNQISDNVMSAIKGIRPSVYLKNNIVITEGTGTSSDPYKLSIK